MLAAFDTLAREGSGAAARPPGPAAAASQDPRRQTGDAVGSEGRLGALAWLKSMVAFHGKKL